MQEQVRHIVKIVAANYRSAESVSFVNAGDKVHKRTRNDIAMAYRIDALPGRVSKVFFYQTLLDFLNGEIEDLPEGWEVTWLWRNSRKSKLRSDSIQNVVGASRDSFM